MEKCSICGQNHTESQTWLYGCGRKKAAGMDGGHYEKGVFVDSCKHYDDVKHGKLVICRHCENTTRLLYEIEKKRSLALCIAFVLFFPMIFSLFAFIRHHHIQSLLVAVVFGVPIWFLTFGRLPPKQYPHFMESEPLDLKEPMTPLDQIVRIIKESNTGTGMQYIWKSEIRDIISQKVSNPKPVLRTSPKLDMVRYQYFMAIADRLMQKGKIYKAIIHTLFFKNKAPTPESFLVLGYIFERLGRIREAVSAYSLSSWMLIDSQKPDCEAERLRNRIGESRQPIQFGEALAKRRLKLVKRIHNLLDRQSKRDAAKAAKLTWHLLLINDPEGPELYARAMALLGYPEIAENAKRAVIYCKRGCFKTVDRT